MDTPVEPIFFFYLFPPYKEYCSEYQERQINEKKDRERTEDYFKRYEEVVAEVTREFNESRGSKRSRIDFEEDLSYLTNAEKDSIKSEKDKLDEEIMNRMIEKSKPTKREVTPCRRLRIVDANNPSRHAILILRQAKQVYDFWKENTCVRITHLHPHNSNGELHLSSSNASLVHFIEKHPFSVPETIKRQSTALALIGSREVPFKEVDIYGLVLVIQTQPQAEVALLTDCQANIVAINFWGCLGEHGLASLVQPGAFLRLENLEWLPFKSPATTSFPFITLFINLHTLVSDLHKHPTEMEIQFINSFKAVITRIWPKFVELKSGNK